MPEQLTVGSLASNQDFLALPPGERIKVIRAVGGQDPEFGALPPGEQDKVAQVMSGMGTMAETPSQGLGAYARGAASSLVNVPMGIGREALGFGQFLRDVPSRIGQASQVDWRDLLRHPGPVGTAALETGKQLAEPIVQSAPEITGGTLGGLLGGPGGIPLGAAMGRETMGLAQGLPAQQRGEQAGAAFLTTLVGQRLPQAIEAAGKVPGRYLSLPAERHAAGAEMMGRIQERFGVSDTLVESKYATAERIAGTQTRQGVGARSDLANFRSETMRLADNLSRNPIPELQDTGMIDRLLKITTQADELANVRGGASAEGVNNIIKSVNKEIGSTKGAERGLWKDVLKSIHDDMRATASRTGDPAFAAYADAIQTARLNFLRDDLQTFIDSSGIRQQRTGVSVITNPGAVKQWMQRNPDWVDKVEKAQPGIIDSIRQDLQEIVPVTDITGRSIPGQRYGSGRLLIGGATAHLLSRTFGLSPGTLEAVGVLIGGLSPQMGIKMSPAYIRGSFAPNLALPSRTGAGVGAVMAPGLGSETGAQ